MKAGDKKPIIKLRFLGTGTSQGVPVIGCDCQVCTSSDTRDKRLRTSALVSMGNTNIVIDAGPDFRYQMLRADVTSVDAILITHEHNDHIIGLDDVRPFNFMQWKDMPLYCTQRVKKDLLTRFHYIFRSKNRYPGAPMIQIHTIEKTDVLSLGGVEVIPIEAWHGRWPVMGFRFDSLTYITDMKSIKEGELEKVKNSKILVVNALHHKEHHSHLNLEQALEFIEKVAPERAYLTHASHRMGLYEEVSKRLPANVFLAYDGLEVF